MRVLLTSHGSTGDIYPLLRLGVALKSAGHTVHFATTKLYQPAVEAAGITFKHLPPDWSQSYYTKAMAELNKPKHPIALMRQIYRSGLPFMGEIVQRMHIYMADDIDLVVGSYIFPYYRAIAHQHGLPFAVINFCHSTVPAPNQPPEWMPKLRGWPPKARRLCYRLGWQFTDWILTRTINQTMASVLRAQNLPKLTSFIHAPADLCLVATSPALMQPPAKRPKDALPPHFQFTGYLRWQSPENETLNTELTTFTRGARVPILTFGSVSFEDVPGIMRRFLLNWPRGERIIVQSGWAGLSLDIDRPEIKIIPPMSHDQLFKHASVVIHHGGAGTTASALHAGVPHIIVPHFGDQPFFAKEIKRLKCGTRLHKKKWPEKLPATVMRLRRKTFYTRNAKQHAATLAKENGPAHAIAALQQLVNNFEG